MLGIAVYPAQKIDTAAFPLKWREHEEAHVLQVSNDQLWSARTFGQKHTAALVVLPGKYDSLRT